MNAKILISFGALLCVAAASVVEKHFELPDARLTIKVIDDAQQPVPNAKVWLGFKDKLTKNDIAVRGLTDADGLFTGQGASDALVGSDIRKDGYYMGSAPIPDFRDAKDGRWQPWDATYEAVLRKIENPVAMYARKISAEIPAVNQPCGFDLMLADWVAPYGQGKSADLVVTVTNRRLDSWFDYDVSATLTFSNRLDGLQEASLPKAYSVSAFKWPRQAPEGGYQPSFSARASWFPQGSGKLPVRTFKDGQAYFFRVRTAESNRQIVSALYGKIDGGIVLEPRETKLCKIIFLYYLNPTPLDRNMESDPKRNLFSNLKDDDRPRDP
jgi:hypothetical protein